jgi:hypothetical protein
MASRPPDNPSPDSRPTGSRDPAQVRFAFIAFHRLLGAALVVMGILVTQGGIDWPRAVGWGLLGLGLLDFFIAPLIFARLWRTPPE